MSKYRYLILLSAKKWFRLTSFVVANVVEYYYLINTTQSLKIAFDSLARAVLNRLNTYAELKIAFDSLARAIWKYLIPLRANLKRRPSYFEVFNTTQAEISFSNRGPELLMNI